MQTCTNKSCIQVLVKHDSLNKFSKDHLLNYLESIWDCSVKELKVAWMGNAAVIYFTEAQDFTTLQKTCSEKPLEEMVLEVKRTFEGGVILVSNPLPTTTDECFMYYFKNTRRSGGDQSARIMKRDPTHKFLLVHFSSKEVAEKVLQGTHCLEDIQLELKAFDPDLDSLPSEQEPEPSQGNLSAAESECHETRDLESTSNCLAHNMQCYETQKQQQMTANENCTRCVEGMHRVYRGIIEVLSEVDSGLFQEVSIKEDGDKLLIEGKSQGDVENIDNLLKSLVRMQATSKYLSKIGEEFTEWDEIFMKIREQIEEFAYIVSVRDAADGSSAEEICIKTCKSCISIDQMLEIFLMREDISVTSHEERDLLTTTEWDRFLTEDLPEESGGKVFAVYKETNNVIMVFAPADLIERAKSCVCQFLSNSHMTEFLELTEMEKTYLSLYHRDKLNDLQVKTGADNITITFDRDVCTISGFRAGVRKAAGFLKKFCKEFFCKREIFYHYGLKIRHETESWQNLIMSVERENKCIITDLPDGRIRCEDGTFEAWGLKLAAVIKSYNSWLNAPFLHLVDGDVNSMRVDAIVQCLFHRDDNYPISASGSDTENFEEKGARPKLQAVDICKTPVQRGVHVVQSGRLPCKAVINIPFENESSMQGDCLKTLVHDILMTAEKHHFTSLAMPTIGVDGAHTPMAIHVACEAIVDGILNYFCQRSCDTKEKVQTSESGRIKHIFLCSSRPACFKGFEFQLEFQHKMGKFTDPNLSLHQYVACKEDSLQGRPVETRNTLQKDSIQVISGDICFIQADAIVVPLDSDLDLSRNRVTSSLSYHGGSRVEKTLRGDGWWSDMIGNRMEMFEMEGILEGSGGNLKAKHVLYLNLPYWGPGASKILHELVEKSLINAGRSSCRSLAFTALGTGTLGYPPEIVSRIMMTTIADYLEQVHSSLETVKIVIFHDKEMELVFDQEYYQWYTQRVIPGVYGHMQSPYPHMSGKEYSKIPKEGKGRGQRGRHGSETSNQHYPQQQSISHRSSANVFSSHHSFQVESVKLIIKVGDITLEKCDMIVNSTNSELDLTRGSVAKAISRRCPHLQAECSKKRYRQQMKKNGLVSTTCHDKLPFKKVLHVDLDKFLKNPLEMFYQCLERLRDTGSLRSIAFPLIGKGSGKMENPSVVGSYLAEAVVKFSKTPNQVKDVLLLVKSHELLPQVVEAVGKSLKSMKIIIQPPFKDKIKKQEKRKGNKENIPYSNAVLHDSFADPSHGHKPDQHNTLSRTPEAVSLFIFSDNKEKCQNAIDAIQCSITEMSEGTSQSHVTGNQSYVNLPPLVYPDH